VSKQPIIKCKKKNFCFKAGNNTLQKLFHSKMRMCKESLLQIIDCKGYVYATFRNSLQKLQLCFKLTKTLRFKAVFSLQKLQTNLSINNQQNCKSFFKATAQVCSPHFKATSSTILLRKLSD
jgi:hypothetical protein